MSLEMKFFLLLAFCFSSCFLCITANGESSISQEGHDFVVRLQDGGGFFIQDVDIMAKLSSLETRIIAIDTNVSNLDASNDHLASVLQSFKACAASGLLYDQTKGSCVNPTVNLAPQGKTTCNSSNYGALRISNFSRPVVCTGDAWSPVGVSLGSFSYNPASSCSAIVTAGDYGSPGRYWIKQSDGSAIQQVCVNTTNLGGDGNSVAASSVSCDALLSYWNKTAGPYFVNGSSIICGLVTFTSCSQALSQYPNLTSQVLMLQISGITYSTWCQFESGVAWTLLMKMDGTKDTFTYDSNLWTTSNSLNQTTGIAGGLSDSVEYKSNLYNILPFTQIRFGMRVNGTTNWLSTPYNASNMLSLTADGVYRSLPLTHTDWVVLSRGRLQGSCDLQGVNVVVVRPDNGYRHRVRFGIIANKENDCIYPDSRLGFGSTNFVPNLTGYCNDDDPGYSVGYICCYQCVDAAGIDIANGYSAQFGFIMIR